MSELETFVLTYLEDVGGVVESAGHGVHEVLLPEDSAERWGVPIYQRLVFADSQQPDVTRLSYNHPWVEQLTAEALARPAIARLYINNLRLDKGELDGLAASQWVVVNGRVTPQKRATVARVRSTYVRFNFKAAILSDEKQERLVSVLLDAQTGYAAVDAAGVEMRATAPSPDEVLRSLPEAPLQWRQSGAVAPEASPLTLTALQGLLARAQTAATMALHDELMALRKRVTRFRELDEARLNEYFDELRRDLEHRLGSAPPERRASLEDKLAAVQQERAHKLADVAGRYQVRVQLSLINLLVIQQAKLVMPITISNRATEVSAYAVWDPVLHRLEPLPCNVCGQPLARLALCHNGHLAHEECLTPPCVDCKRLFCQLCREDMGECVVCHRPLCRHSRIACPECKRGTCQEHRNLCHANQGQPADLTRLAAPPLPPPLPVPADPPRPIKPAAQRPGLPTSKPPAPRPTLARPAKPKVTGINVVIDTPIITAYVLGPRMREVALREWSLEPEEGGIIRRCTCEKGPACRANHMVLRPMDAKNLGRQMLVELNELAVEYDVPTGKLKYFRVSPLNGQLFETPRFEAIGVWKDETLIRLGQETFDRRYRR